MKYFSGSLLGVRALKLLPEEQGEKIEPLNLSVQRLWLARISRERLDENKKGVCSNLLTPLKHGGDAYRVRYADA
jgi:hypothetical protein